VAPLLHEAEIPGTFFLSGASLRGVSSFWWQDLQSVADRGGEAWVNLMRDVGAGSPSPPASLRSLAQMIEAMAPPDRDRASKRIREAAGPAATDSQLSSDEIKRLARGGFEIGFHTLRHPNLQMVGDACLAHALTDGLDEIQALTGYRPTSIAYPHCRADARVGEAARAAGFHLGCVCDGGAVRQCDDPLLIDRIDGWSESVGSLALRLARTAASS
jgi:peptidoglycan/xylan/chitin deacetylase (PgdA/CDA1 family)